MKKTNRTKFYSKPNSFFGHNYHWWLGPVNFLLFQWFFVRLAVYSYNWEDDGMYDGFLWIKGVVPLTGWWSDYRYIWKRK